MCELLPTSNNVISLQIKERVLCTALPLWGWQQLTEKSSKTPSCSLPPPAVTGSCVCTLDSLVWETSVFLEQAAGIFVFSF